MRLLILLFAFLVFGCATQEAAMHDQPERRTTIMGQKDVDFLREILFEEREGWYSEKMTGYLFTELLLNEQVSFEVMHRRAALRERIRYLQKSEIVCGWRNTSKTTLPFLYTEDEAVNKLKPYMLARLSLLLHELNKDSSVRKIGALIEKDLGDVSNNHVVPTEIGGMGLITEGKLMLLPVPSVEAPQLNTYANRASGELVSRDAIYRTESNMKYGLPLYAVTQIPHIFTFHIHAISREYVENTCGPSIGKDMHGRLIYDIGAVYAGAKEYGEWHSVIFSTHGKRAFSTHYVVGERFDEGSVRILVFSLPIKRY